MQAVQAVPVPHRAPHMSRRGLNMTRPANGGMGLEKRQGRAGGPGRRAAGRFGAAGAALGFQYQTRYALLLLLRAEDGVSLTMEKADDIALERDEAAGEWIQTKHHKRPAPIGDTSRDLWKTLRNWSVSVRRGSLDPSNHRLTLVTTSKIMDGTAASMLQPAESGKRDAQEALRLLLKTARTKEPASNADYYAEFAGLKNDDRSKLLNSITILPSEPNVVNVMDQIKKELRTASPQGKRDEFAERVEGWWANRAIESMYRNTPIRRTELQSHIDDIREQFTTENLPVDYAGAHLPPSERARTRTFVRQLDIIGVVHARQQVARLDYYKAYKQRSQWVVDDLVMIDELKKYDKRLYEMWFDLFHRMREDLAGCNDENTRRETGRHHYNATTDRDVRIRRDVSVPYVMRGSLHMLADKLKIGWHPDYHTLLASQHAGAGGTG